MLDSAWVALSLSNHIGTKTLNALMGHFGYNPRAILEADLTELRRVRGIGPKIASAIKEINLAQIELDIEAWGQAGVSILTPDIFSPNLRALDDRPPTLFIRGKWPRMTAPTYAIVGTRDPTPESSYIAHEFASKLAQKGSLIVSGLAIGIDINAHLGALAVKDGCTIAVLGSGVLNVYPPENRAFAEAIVNRGAIACEVHPQAGVNPASLVARNRIISGLSDGVIVIETSVDGGAMHAARFAKLHGRTVYAIDNAASGNRALIANGAVPIRPDLRDLPI